METTEFGRSSVPIPSSDLKRLFSSSHESSRLCEFVDIPRRTIYQSPLSEEERSVPQIERIRFAASALRTVWRVFVGLSVAIHFYTLVNYDRLFGRKSNRYRAIRLRQAFERLGGTFIKVGQQLSMRLDVLSPDHCRELGKMLDDVPPFPFSQAIQRIENAVGGPIGQVFSKIDPRPIGSASIACVYQGYLHSGQKVAIKVRRPNIGVLFATDLRALHWTFSILEWLTVLRPEFSRHLQHDLSRMLMEELDLRKESRYQYLFRRMAKKAKLRCATAPVVYRDLSSSDVIIQEFVSGYWLSEVIDAVESNDTVMLKKMRDAGIRPKKIAVNLIMTSYWSTQECSFFHADPHPRNILVQAGGQLVFIDFGACGSMTPRTRESTVRIFECMRRQDVTGAALATLTTLEPLPHIDVDSLVKAIEEVFKERIITFDDNQAMWWERTSAVVWMAFLSATREFNLPVNRDSLRAMRASLLYDTISARLDPKLKPANKLYSLYEKKRAKRRAKTVIKRLNRLDPEHARAQLVERVSEGVGALSTVAYRLGDFASERPVRLASLSNKASFFLISLIRYATSAIMLGGTVALSLVLFRYYRGTYDSKPIQVLGVVLTHPAYIVAIFSMLVLKIRAIHARLNDTDTN